MEYWSVVVYTLYTMQQKISIIIPCWNEEQNIARCLESIARQRLSPHEVIVVDNNSTDNTVSIARSYDFVTVLHETIQGLTPARNTGFNSATGEVIARINADIILDDDWVEQLSDIFAQESCTAVTGPVRTPLMLRGWRGSSPMWSKMYFLGATVWFGTRVMWGGNMAMRRSVWYDIRPYIHGDDSLVHEDQDASLCLARLGYSLRQVNSLLVSTDESSYGDWPKLREYLSRGVRTRRIHEDSGSYSAPAFYRVPFLLRVAIAIVALPLSLFVIISVVDHLIHGNKK